jgi:hypothetical protein
LLNVFEHPMSLNPESRTGRLWRRSWTARARVTKTFPS